LAAHVLIYFVFDSWAIRFLSMELYLWSTKQNMQWNMLGLPPPSHGVSALLIRPGAINSCCVKECWI